MLKKLENKSVLILGLGREGMSSLKYFLRHYPQNQLAVADQLAFERLSVETQSLLKKYSQVKTFLGKNYLTVLDNYDVIIRTPGISPFLTALTRAKKQGKFVISQTQLFFELFPGKIIGITGTKGKSTTTKLIYEILRQAKRDVFLVGNIGLPALDVLDKAKPESLAVYELSSHQLADLSRGPDIAVILNIVPEHLDYYQDKDEYMEAKGQITFHQGPDDYLIFNPQYPNPKKLAARSKAQKRYISLEQEVGPGAFVKDGFIEVNDSNSAEIIMPTAEVPLKGAFNLENVCAAIMATRVLGVDIPIQVQAIKAFKSLPHRLEFGGEYKGISFYNDSLATV
ncbi:UDP-N-acetylmuramoylalanine--D-glutamate ligase, partial [Candidatus Beckwithbacteria bacterium RBG_13_42_9]